MDTVLKTEEALAAGAFGVSSFAVDGRLFCGLDSLPMLKAYLDGDGWFDGKDWIFAKDVPVGIVCPR